MRALCPRCGDVGMATDYMEHDPDHYRCRNGECRVVMFAWNPNMEAGP